LKTKGKAPPKAKGAAKKGSSSKASSSKSKK
jgi:hypothetical protein